MGAEGHQDGTVGKALDVLDMVASHGGPVRFTDLLANAGYPKATLYRLLQTLTNQGMLAYDDASGTYALGVRLVRLAHAAWAQSSLAPIARPYLDELAAKTGETIHLAQMDLGQVLYVDKRNAAKPVDMFSSAGKVGPAYCTGVGKAMLAYLDDEALDASAGAAKSFHRFTAAIPCETALRSTNWQAIRSRGYAFDREEHEPGIICMRRADSVRARAGLWGRFRSHRPRPTPRLAALEGSGAADPGHRGADCRRRGKLALSRTGK